MKNLILSGGIAVLTFLCHTGKTQTVATPANLEQVDNDGPEIVPGRSVLINTEDDKTEAKTNKEKRKAAKKAKKSGKKNHHRIKYMHD